MRSHHFTPGGLVQKLRSIVTRKPKIIYYDSEGKRSTTDDGGPAEAFGGDCPGEMEVEVIAVEMHYGEGGDPVPTPFLLDTTRIPAPLLHVIRYWGSVARNEGQPIHDRAKIVGIVSGSTRRVPAPLCGIPC